MVSRSGTYHTDMVVGKQLTANIVAVPQEVVFLVNDVTRVV